MVLAASDMPAMPATVTPMPACAIAAPHTDSFCAARRGARRGEWDAEQPGALDDFGECAEDQPGRRGEASGRQAGAQSRAVAMPTMAAISAAHHSLRSAGQSSARFHGSTGPSDMAANNGSASGNTVALKYGGPTLSFAPNSSSANSG